MFKAKFIKVLSCTLILAVFGTLFVIPSPALADDEWTSGFSLRTNTRYRISVFEDMTDAGDASNDESQIELYANFLIDRELGPNLFFHLNPRMVLSVRHFQERAKPESENEIDIELRGFSLKKTRLFHPLSSLTLGRSRLKEERAWWWDKDFTAIRLSYDATLLHMEIGLGERLLIFDITEDDREDDLKDIRLLFGTVSAQWHFQHFLEARILYQYDGSMTEQVGDAVSTRNFDEEDGKLFWVGLRAKGMANGSSRVRQLRYWADFSLLYGDVVRLSTQIRNGLRVVDARNSMTIKEAWAADMGLMLKTNFPLQPAVLFSYARARGDRSERGSVRQFKQPDLSTNRGRFAGNTLIRYYGEALRPDLSNLHILTAGFSFSLVEPLYFQTILHKYWQDVAAPRLSGTRLGLSPSGNDSDIGEAIDFILEGAPEKWWNIAFVFGIFRAGTAYEGAADTLAYWSSFQLRAVF